jgi:hypothetical protein
MAAALDRRPPAAYPSARPRAARAQEGMMADLRGVGKPITYEDDNPLTQWTDELRRQRNAQKREPQDQAERELLGRWMGFRGRWELEHIVAAGCYAYVHFADDLDTEWRFLLADHIRSEAGHGVGYVKQGDLIDPSRDHSLPDPEFAAQYGLAPRTAHFELQKRDFLTYLFAGNNWPYGLFLATTISGIKLFTPRVRDFEEQVVHAEERGHHNAMLQKYHDYVWQQIEEHGEATIRQRIAAIDRESLNAGSYIPFYPPWRSFLQQYLDAPLDSTARFFEWREYLYLNVLGFPPEPVEIKHWPAEIPQPQQPVAAS